MKKAMIRFVMILGIAGLLTMVAGCNSQKGKRTAVGAVIGTAAGASIGGIAGGGDGALIGGLLGGLSGGILGHSTHTEPKTTK